ncbi:MAG: formate dehydrogenase accessory sulfurtransferase FdhD, partial [Atribacterota bacterium]
MVRNNLSSKIKIIRIEDKKRFSITDLTAREVNLVILLNNQEFTSLNCSPGNYQFLAVGFLYTNGIITRSED